MTTALLVSVVIPLHNKAPYVERAVRSALAQAGADVEIVVVDDGSTDDGPARVAALADERIRLVSQANAGVSVARNRGIELARGEFVAFLDADDAMLPGHLAGLRRATCRFPDADAFCTGYVRRHPDGTMRRFGLPLPDTGPLASFHDAWSRQAFTNTNSMLIRRSLLARLWPPFAPGERLGEDQDLWLRVAEAAGFIYVPQALTEYHVDMPGAATAGARVLDPLPCFERLAARLDAGQIPPALRPGARRLLASHLLNVARDRLAAGDRRGAWALVSDRRSRANPRYWLRTLLCLAMPRRTEGVAPD